MLTTIVPWSQYKTLKFSQCSIFSKGVGGGALLKNLFQGGGGGTCPGCPPGSYAYAMSSKYLSQGTKHA